MMRKLVAVVVLFIAIFALSAPGVKAEGTEPIVKVKLSHFIGQKDQLPLSIKGKYVIEGIEDRIILSEGRSYTISTTAGGPVCLLEGSAELACGTSLDLKPVTSGSFIYLNKKAYNGLFNFTSEAGKIKPVNSIYMEDYVKGVVPEEMLSYWHPEALKAQALAARTYAVEKKENILSDTTSKQVYGGYLWAKEIDRAGYYVNSSAAVEATAGEYITFGGKPIDAVYSSSNGGLTELNSNYWTTSDPYPYLTVKPDPHDGLAKDEYVTNWKVLLQKQQIASSELEKPQPEVWWETIKEADEQFASRVKGNLLAQQGENPDNFKVVSVELFNLHTFTSGERFTQGDLHVKFIRKNSKDADGRYNIDLFRGTIPAWEAAYLLGEDAVGIPKLRSRYVKDVIEADGVYIITGSGFGHGVGMSQYGAQNRARYEGQSYREILSFYYTGTEITKSYTKMADRNSYLANVNGWVIEDGIRTYYDGATRAKATGWKQIDNNWYYFEEGQQFTGWLLWNNKKYYLNSEGIMQTGWLELDGKKYYLNQDGSMQIGWLTLGDKKYYFNQEGIMQTGVVTIDGTQFTFGEDGALEKLAGWIVENGKRSYYDPSTGQKINSGWKLIDNAWYFFENGAAKTGWVYWKYKWYYLDAGTGKMLTGWINDGSKRYYLNSEGIMQTGWLKYNNKWYFLAKSGAMHKGWLTDGGKKYYLKSDGIMATGWMKIGTSWYYFHSSGEMDTGWLKWNNKWYYMNSYGIMQTGWEKVGTKWYYLASGGEMKTGWLKDGTKWYYLDSSGIMQTGWVKVGTKWYYLYSSGAMAANTTIGGYRLGSDGAWIL
ncbi:SpoIID/LytB domain-containing protein [Mesobacillus sp. LC4]